MSRRRPEAVSFQILQDCGLGNQQPVPKRNGPNPALSHEAMNGAVGDAEFGSYLPTRIMLFNHSPILQASNASAAAGPRAQNASQVHVM
jgi:hypothetical protein